MPLHRRTHRERGSVALIGAAVALLTLSGVMAEEGTAPESVAPAPTIVTDGEPVSLAQALAKARQRNESYAISREELRQVYIARQAAWANVSPTFTASGSFTRSGSDGGSASAGSSGASTSGGTQNTFGGSVRLAMTLFQGSAIPGLLAAYDAADASEHTTQWAQTALDYEVAQAFYGVLSAEQLLQAARASEKAATEHLSAIRSRRAAGDALMVDETRQNQVVVKARVERISAESVLENSMDYLMFLLDASRTIRPLQPDAPMVPDAALDKLVEEALSRRPDVKAARLSVSVNKRSQLGAWMNFLPSLGMAYAYNAYDSQGGATNWNFALTASWELWDGGVRLASSRKAQSQVVTASLQERQLRRQIQLEVHKARRAVDTAAQSREAALESRELARQNSTLVNERYHAGLATGLELVDAEDVLFSSEVTVVTSELDYALSVLNLYKTLGRTPLGQPLPR